MLCFVNWCNAHCQKLGMNLVTRWTKSEVKNYLLVNKWSSKLIFLIEKKNENEKIRLVFDIENWLYRYNFGAFCQCRITSIYKYRISVNSFRGKYSFLNLTLCTVTLFTIHTGAETNQGRKLFKGRNYSQK